MKKSLVAMTCVLALTAALATPAAAAPRGEEGAWRAGLWELALEWLAEVLPGWTVPDRPEARVVAGNQGGGAGDGSGTTFTSCEICVGTQGRYHIDPDG